MEYNSFYKDVFDVVLMEDVFLFEGSKSSLEEMMGEKFVVIKVNDEPMKVVVDGTGYANEGDSVSVMKKTEKALRAEASKVGASAMVECRYHFIGRTSGFGEGTECIISGYAVRGDGFFG